VGEILAQAFVLQIGNGRKQELRIHFDDLKSVQVAKKHQTRNALIAATVVALIAMGIAATILLPRRNSARHTRA
jgi:hypothetical protein